MTLFGDGLIKLDNITHIEYGTIAVATAGGEKVVVIPFTVWQAISFKEVPRTKLILAMGAGEVFRVPDTTKRCYNLGGGERKSKLDFPVHLHYLCKLCKGYFVKHRLAFLIQCRETVNIKFIPLTLC